MRITRVEVFLGVSLVVCGAIFFKRPPDTSQDWAAWLQAVGSVAAIGLAVWLAQDARRDQVNAAQREVKAFAATLDAACQRMLMAATPADRRGAAFAIEEAMTIGRAVQLGSLGDEVLTSLLNLRVYAAELVAHTYKYKNADRDLLQIDHAFLLGESKRLLVKIQAERNAVVVLSKGLPRP